MVPSLMAVSEALATWAHSEGFLSGTTDFYQGHPNRHDQGPRADEPGATGALYSMHPLGHGSRSRDFGLLNL